MILGQKLVLHSCIDCESHRLHAVRTLAGMSGRGVLAALCCKFKIMYYVELLLESLL
jgi:hypothetical protein